MVLFLILQAFLIDAGNDDCQSDKSSFSSLHAPKAVKMTVIFLITAGNEDCQSDRAFQKHVNPRALKIATLYKKRYLSVYGWDILCGILKIPFEIPHKLSYPNHGWVTVTTNRSYHQPRWRRPKTASPNKRGYHQLAAIPTGTITSWYREVGNIQLPLQ